jgi:hypothetical protein
MIACAAKIVKTADVSAGAKRALAGAENNDPIDTAVALPLVKGSGH